MAIKMGEDYLKLTRISGLLLGSSPAILNAKVARRLAEKVAERALAEYRAKCEEALLTFHRGTTTKRVWSPSTFRKICKEVREAELCLKNGTHAI